MDYGPTIHRFRLHVVIAFVAAMCMASVAHGATAIITVTATVLRNLSVGTQSNLAFGAVDTSAAEGELTLGYDGTRRATGGTRIEGGSVATPATLVIQGQPDAAVSISVPRTTRISGTGGASMLVDHFLTSGGAVNALDNTGSGVVRVGATLHVKANQPLGDYAGVMQITVNYN